MRAKTRESITSLVGAISSSLDRLVRLIRKLVTDGRIVATCTDPDDWGKNPWYVYVSIPSLMEGFSMGPSDDLVTWGAGNALAAALKNVFGCTPNTYVTRDYGFDYR